MQKLNDYPSLDPSALRHTVTINSPSATKDSVGQSVNSLTPVLATSASIKSVAQKEVLSSGQLSSQVTHIIEIRWPSVAISAGMVVTFQNHYYRVQGADNVEQRNRILRLMCLEINGVE